MGELKRARSTLEFKMQAVRLVKAGQSLAAVSACALNYFELCQGRAGRQAVWIWHKAGKPRTDGAGSSESGKTRG